MSKYSKLTAYLVNCFFKYTNFLPLLLLMRSLILCTPHPILFGNKIEKNEMGGARSAYGERYTGFLWGNLRERDHMQDPSVDGKMILRWIFRKCDLGQDRSDSG